VKPEAIARGTGIYAGIGMFSSAIGPALFGALIGYLGGQYWGGFLFLAVLNAVGAAGYIALHWSAYSGAGFSLRRASVRQLAAR
jgi:MFS-type transporter involved in bile tolerance (Atg22 family)